MKEIEIDKLIKILQLEQIEDPSNDWQKGVNDNLDHLIGVFIQAKENPSALERYYKALKVQWE